MEKDYIVTVKTMLLVGTELRVWVTAKEWEAPPLVMIRRDRIAFFPRYG
ncbi:hypothetical protein [Paenibacillus silviterrae]|nr:hypothetical protein [Paenibacillus chinjuensis]